MFYTELLPVTVFRSTDEAAPQLTATAGSLKTILKACLKEGYGSKAPLGWDMPYEDAHRAIFVSADPKSTRTGLHIDNTAPRMAVAKLYNRPTGIDTATDARFINNGKFPYMRSAANSNNWAVVGHGRAFCLLLERGYQDSRYAGRMLWFGDFPSAVAADSGNCLLWQPGDNNDAAGQAYPPRTLSVSSSTSFAPAVLAKPYDNMSYGATGVANSLFDSAWGLAYPDVIGNGFSASEIYVHEYARHIDAYPLRGLWPGLYVCANDLSNVPNLSAISGLNGSDDVLLKISLYDNGINSNYKYTHLINATAWPA